MAGTDNSKDMTIGGPAIILVKPQLGENIGMVARAMLNCGLSRLWLVDPRDGWPNDIAWKTASGADVVLDNVKVFQTVEEAIKDLTLVFATTARPRDIVKPIVTPEQAAIEAQAVPDEQVGFLFGRENWGLDNSATVLANKIINIPLNPAFSSLNLSQAVLLVAYAYLKQSQNTPAEYLSTRRDHDVANQESLLQFYERLEGAIEEHGFFSRVEEKRELMQHSIRSIFARNQLSNQEVNILHGILSALLKIRRPGSKKSQK